MPANYIHSWLATPGSTRTLPSWLHYVRCVLVPCTQNFAINTRSKRIRFTILTYEKQLMSGRRQTSSFICSRFMLSCWTKNVAKAQMAVSIAAQNYDTNTHPEVNAVMPYARDVFAMRCRAFAIPGSREDLLRVAENALGWPFHTGSKAIFLLSYHKICRNHNTFQSKIQ